MANLVADAKGVIRGKFRIPANVKAGSKLVKFKGVENGGNGEAVFTGSGSVITITKRQVTNETFVYLDPLAQTFILSASRQLSSVDLRFVAVGVEDVIVQVRSTTVGFPTQEIMCEGRVKAADINANGWTNIQFDEPFFAKNNVEYALVVLSNDPVTSCAISELGKYDTVSQSYVTSQPFNVGVLLSSINASTWTAHQDKTLAFRLKARKYTEANRVINLGSVTVNGITDLVLSGNLEIPETGSDGQFTLIMPDGTTLNMSSQQNVVFQQPVSGKIHISATIRSNGITSAKLTKDSQLVCGTMSNDGVYVTRAINGNASGATVQVRYLGIIPSGANVKVFWGTNQADTAWTEMPVFGSPVLVDGNYQVYEYTHRATNVASAAVRIKIELTGSPSARPYVYNHRTNII